MKLFRVNIQQSLFPVNVDRKPSVMTIGNFDGIHLGHQAILNQLVSKASQHGLSAQILIFEPQPREFFATEDCDILPPKRLMTWRQKYNFLCEFKLERLNLVKFNDAFSQLNPEAFVDQILLGLLNVRCLILGDDFRFGAGRSGDLNFLIDQGNCKGFKVERAQTLSSVDESLGQQRAHRRVSSTWIREALDQGDLKRAQLLMGRPYEMSGRVQMGQQIGRTWGFPTANIAVLIDPPVLRGVFAVSVSIVSPDASALGHVVEHAGVANLGKRPTLGGQAFLLEVHLLDFEGDLYGRRLRVKFHYKIRDERKFDDEKALIEAIRMDHQYARNYWQERRLNEL